MVINIAPPASMFTFLYRTVHEHVPAQEAYTYVKRVWDPLPHWKAFGRMVLKKHNIDFAFE
jgi:hypothetical protein